MNHYESLILKLLEEKQKRFPHLEYKGCTPEDIVTIMEAQQVRRLPDLYQYFLLYCGQGHFYNPSVAHEYTYPNLLSFKSNLVDIYKYEAENGRQISIKFPEDAFIFLQGGDSGFTYFLTENTDDNPQTFYLSLPKGNHKATNKTLYEILGGTL